MAAVLTGVAVLSVSIGVTRPVVAQKARPDLAGTWTLNRPQSQLPTDVGFGMTVGPDKGDSPEPKGPGGEEAGRGVMAIPKMMMASPEEAEISKELVNNERVAPSTIVILQTDTTVSISDGHPTRTFHPGGKEDIQQLLAGPIGTISKWDGPRLVIEYTISKDRKLRYTYGRETATSPLVVLVQFLEKGKGDAMKRVYDLKSK
jgi:hypothetical protein